MREFLRSYRDWSRLVEAFPRDLSDVLRRISSGAFEVHMEHRRLEKTVNRLVQGVLIAALFVTSGLMWANEAAPAFEGVSVVGALGYLVAAALGFRLLWTSSAGTDDNGKPL
jgi:ubiquinone biosynthesis protein